MLTSSSLADDAAGLTLSSSMSSYFLPESHSSLCSTHNAVTSRKQASRFGKIRTTLVRRLSTWLKRSSPFVERIRHPWGPGNAKHASVASIPSSSHLATAGWEALQRSTTSLARDHAHPRSVAA